MLYIHPVFQSLVTLLVIYVLNIGVHRFRALHLKHKTRFNWKRHVKLGKLSLATLLIGALSGAMVAKAVWGVYLATGLHAGVGMIIVPLTIFGFGSGFYMERKKKKRAALPLLHEINNSMLLILCLLQAATGMEIIKSLL